MSWTYNSVNNTKLATHVNPTNDRYGRIYFDNESITINWTGGSEAVSWVLRNYYGVIVASGTLTGGQTSLNLGVLPVGWYKIYFAATPGTNTTTWRDARGELSFIVARSTSALRTTPIANGTTWAVSGNNGVHPVRALIGHAQYRVDVDLDSTHGAGAFAATLSSAQSQGTLQNTWKPSDSARSRPMLIQFPDGTGGTAPTGTDNTQIQSAVSSLYGTYGYTHFEGRNEPNTGAYTAANIVSELQAFYNNVKAGNASAKVLGGCSVNITDSAYIGGILAAGAAAYMDEMSIHTYNGTNGNLGAGRESWEFLKALLAQYNFTKPLYMTEYGQFAWCAGSFEPRLQVQWMMLDLHLAAQYGIPHEKYMWYYDTNVGFWGYPSFMWTSDYSNPMPTATPAVLRVWAEEIWGKPFAARLNFGPSDDEFIGSRFTAADGTSVIALQSGGGLETISFDVAGTSGPLVQVSTFGALSNLAVVSGKVQVTIGPEPSYVRLPNGVTMVPSAHDFGVEVVRKQYSIPSASSNDSTDSGGPDVIVDGKLSNGGYTIGPKPYLGGSSDGSNAWARIDFPRVTRLDRIHVFCPHPWQYYSTLLDFDIQYLDTDNVTWLTAATFTDTSAVNLTINWSSHIISGACFSDSFWDRRHNFRFVLADAISTKAIRVFAREMSNGGGARPEINNGFGKVDGDGNPCNNGQTGPERMALMEVRAWLSGTSDGGTGVLGQPVVALNTL